MSRYQFSGKRSSKRNNVAFHRPMRERFSIVELLENRVLLTTYHVTTPFDNGAGSLRDAIMQANANPGADTIDFQLSGGGTIHLSSALPAITDALTLTGPGGGSAVVIDGTGAGAGVNGLEVDAAGSTISGLSIENFSGNGINLATGGNTVRQCIISGNALAGVQAMGDGNQILSNSIGTDASGEHGVGNGGNGVNLDGASHTVVRGNIVSANDGNGVRVRAGDGNVIAGNLIGTDAGGTFALGNAGNGVMVDTGASNTVVGGAGAADRNILSGNSGSGVYVASGAGMGNQILGNYVGTDVTGSKAVGNQGDGVTLWGVGVIVCGNVISGNVNNGVSLFGGGNTFASDRVGTAADGVSPLANGSDGFWIQSNNNVIGQAGKDNTIAYNVNTGVDVWFMGGNTIRFNSIFANGYLGIDLGADGHTINDSAGHDGSNNNYQNFPVITGMTNVNGELTISGMLTADANMTYTIDLYATDTRDAQQYGQGRMYLTSVTVTTDATGHAVFTGVASGVPSSQSYIVGTATDGIGNTSEFSLAVAIPAPTSTSTATSTTLSIDKSTSKFGDAVTFTATVTPSGGTLPLTGSVSFYDVVNGTMVLLGSGTLSSTGNAVYSTSALSAGHHSIVAVYNADPRFTGSQSSAMDENVMQTPTTVGISGHVYLDRTGNGLSGDDTGLAGITVKLFRDTNNNGVLDGHDQLVASTVSASDGSYSFANLAAGKYFVVERNADGYVRTAPGMGEYYTENLSGTLTSVDFDNFKLTHSRLHLKDIGFQINGVKSFSELGGHTHEGDTVTVKFTIRAGQSEALSFVSYIAPEDPHFNRKDAGQQVVYNYQTGTFSAGATDQTFTMTIKIPKCFYQVDFVSGQVIDHFGAPGSGIFYGAQDRLFSNDNGGSHLATGIVPIGGTVVGSAIGKAA